ncbi:hypothetical protein DEJ13_13395 [Curtobacterium sp. MCLR17_007]|uniref:hypothetical protein n=1 Tax=Curtobacterium sp. MCLR17_007 TaxID=2175648 RepID=UPI000DA89F90|nr:hypothetical protein [Curtobacterium sp. MCLR17_007]WIB59430.1 hypothetical protein DEJ13_13395 [Curtobacterium sp. MCLR17_007]
MNRRVRVLVTLLLSAALVVGGSSAAWALWTTSAGATSSTVIGKLAASISGTDQMTVTFSDSVRSMTKPVTLTNTGNLAGTTSTSVAPQSDKPAALAGAVDVVAWPVGSTAACTDSAAVGSGSVTGTWASLPSMTSTLAAGASAVWCTRSTPQASAPASSTSNVVISLTTTWGSWRSAVVQGGFYLNTAAATTATPALTCTDHSGNYVDVRWPDSSRAADTWYAAYVRDTMVGSRAQMYSGFITLAPNDLAPVATTGTQTVVVKVLDGDGNPTSTVAGSGPVTLFTQNDGPALRCGG